MPTPPAQMPPMAPVTLPYLLRERSRHGRTVYYVRVGASRRVRVLGEPGSTEFLAAYTVALQSLAAAPAPQPAPEARRVKPGSVAMAVNTYLASASLGKLATAGQRRHERTLRAIAAALPDLPLSSLTDQVIEASRPDTPGAADNFVKIVRRWLAWCVKQKLVETNAAAAVDLHGQINPDGHTEWTDAEVAARRAAWPVGTMPRLALELLLNTSLRRADLVAVGWQHINGGRIRFTPAKTRHSSGVALDVPVVPALRVCLDAQPRDEHLAVLRRGDGKPFASGNSFANFWKKWQIEAGLAPINLHGARKHAAISLAEAGGTVPEIMAILGHSTPTQAMRYARRANRRTLSDAAMARLHRDGT
jgi:integrase/recombinase XerD